MRTHMYDMGDMRRAAPALDGVPRQSRGKRFSTVPVALLRKLEEARSREVLLAVELPDPLAGAVENRRSARQADGQKSLRSNQPHRRLPRLFLPECVLDVLLPYRRHSGETRHVSFGFPLTRYRYLTSSTTAGAVANDTNIIKVGVFIKLENHLTSISHVLRAGSHVRTSRRCARSVLHRDVHNFKFPSQT